MNIRDSSMPRPVQAFVEFAQILRANGFAVSPEQTSAYVEAIGLLGPRDIADIRNAGIAMLSIPRSRWPEYDALFRAFFLGQTVSAPVSEDADDETEAHDTESGTQDVDIDGEEEEAGRETSRGEQLSHREFHHRDPSSLLQGFSRRLPKHLPKRRSQRWQAARRGEGFDFRKNVRKALLRDGEIFDLARRKRKLKQRPLVLLIDVSGSMKEQSEGFLRLAHSVVKSADRAEVFTLGTRLTRITDALRTRDQETALADVSGLVADFDGGTRIGDALQALLSVPRFAAKLRGASVVVLSDGLERGDPDAMVDAVARISRMAWRQDWLSPLAGADDFAPRTEALQAALPFMDRLDSSGNLQLVAEHILALATLPSRRRAA